MGGRGASLKKKNKNNPSNSKKGNKIKVDKNTKIEQVEGGMSIDTADNHNANPNYMGGRKALALYNTKNREFNALSTKIEQKQAEFKRNPSPGARRELQSLISQRKQKAQELLQMQWTSRGYSENCQRSVIAYELRRRGYKVTAQPAPTKGKDTGYRPAILAFKNRENIKLPKTVAKRGDYIDSKLKSKLKAGERGVITFHWRDPDGKRTYGHTINVERKKNGSLLYVDSQIGKKSKKFNDYIAGKNGIIRRNSN
ncbi:hypothetical protein FC52_GL000858 [Lactobacillus pasteurii DSM 23907 = CRBIP 24.76]|uniref:Tox-PL domain-containing protein n=1 Tax=Lactobacillus pasteurii DSM 23907 = CRBIP 24.76 TaxID=1423790 RepID=I7LB66_9LACO|nr:toxin glutamine deamidase domain-containing protein [Lactobacillus pasteurii]KRK07263.1 hypothetical protein FC52_GL000858 [Lactobacillus pasteurii DSM 23907 = CRBIP 24.76]TDG76605.1 hypothetical protein C5L33_001364 [Lactobacillus pasteurii]CCI85301.1 Putative uncharacterized protein [Lactobacillus pasteurii DSM 23907 = CRBIP 24.76]